MFNELRLNLEDDATFYYAIPENLQNEDIEIQKKWINNEDDNEDLEAGIDDEMEKDGSSKSEICVTSVVSKEIEMTPVGNSLSYIISPE